MISVDELPVCIVGAGPAGMAMARALRETRVAFDVFELRQHVTFGVSVDAASRDGDGNWTVTLSNGSICRYRALVCAVGVTWIPNIPSIPGRFNGEVRHSNTYKDCRECEGRRVLVVGAGNSGVDIACEAARHASAAFLSVRRGYQFFPKHIFGVPLDEFVRSNGALLPTWVKQAPNLSEMLDSIVGDLTRFGLPRPDHAAYASHPILNTQVLHHLAHGDLKAKPDIESFDGDDVVFKDGTREKIDLVLLATGYKHAIPFLEPALFDWRGDRPVLYLNMFHPTIDNLYVLGFVEFASSVHGFFDAMGQLVAALLVSDSATRQRFTEIKASYQPDTRGGRVYIDSPRHANYVERDAYRRALTDIRERLNLDPEIAWLPAV